MTQPALVIDGMSIFRSVAGPAAHLRNGYTYSFLIQVTAAVKKFKPKGIFICWEGGYSERLKIFPEYKKNRKGTGETLRAYRDTVKTLMGHLGVDQVHAPGYEADDVGALLANTLDEAILFSHDKDWLQLVRPGISVYQKTRKQGQKKEKVLITSKNFAEVTGWSSPDQFLKSLIACGDPDDDIPGLFGIGDGTIAAYLNGMKLGDRTQEKLDEFFADSELFLRNKSLIDLTQIKSLPVITSFGKYDERSALNLLEELTFASITKKFDEWVSVYREALL